MPMIMTTMWLRKVWETDTSQRDILSPVLSFSAEEFYSWWQRHHLYLTSWHFSKNLHDITCHNAVTFRMTVIKCGRY
jgi:hypothetical protein